jgi:hypothetical protein
MTLGPDLADKHARLVVVSLSCTLASSAASRANQRTSWPRPPPPGAGSRTACERILETARSGSGLTGSSICCCRNLSPLRERLETLTRVGEGRPEIHRAAGMHTAVREIPRILIRSDPMVETDEAKE